MGKGAEGTAVRGAAGSTVSTYNACNLDKAQYKRGVFEKVTGYTNMVRVKTGIMLPWSSKALDKTDEDLNYCYKVLYVACLSTTCCFSFGPAPLCSPTAHHDHAPTSNSPSVLPPLLALLPFSNKQRQGQPQLRHRHPAVGRGAPYPCVCNVPRPPCP